MQISNLPLKWYVPFAQNDSSRVEIPVTTSDATRASQSLGFPPLTMQPPESGGVPPQGEDFNGAMNQVARIAWWLMGGGPFPFDATFAGNSNVNGYPQGALVESADYVGAWLSTADNNQNNPDTVGTNWVPAYAYGTYALTGQVGGTTTLGPNLAKFKSISVAGTLTSALTIVVPNWIYDWTFTNNTTGAFGVTVKTAAGSGVAIPQNSAPTTVTGDGTNITQTAKNIAIATQPTQAAQFSQTHGRLINTQYITASGTYTPTAGTMSALVRGIGGGGAGGGTANPGSGSCAAGGGGAAGAYGELNITNPVATAVTIGAGGAGALGGGGGAGGTTTFGALMTLPGGGGGVLATSVSAASGTGQPGTISGAPTGGSLHYQGAIGDLGIAFSATAASGGNGASSALGGGGILAATNSVGAAFSGGNGTGYGSGGGGGVAVGASAASSGGNGAPGIIIVYEYA